MKVIDLRPNSFKNTWRFFFHYSIIFIDVLFDVLKEKNQSHHSTHQEFSNISNILLPVLWFQCSTTGDRLH